MRGISTRSPESNAIELTRIDEEETGVARQELELAEEGADPKSGPQEGIGGK